MENNTVPRQHKAQDMLLSYVLGFVLSVILTLDAYLLVVSNALSGGALVAAVVGLALVQLVVQLLFFLHIDRGPGARWNIAMFLFMLLVVFIVVGGSLWIMNNLDYNMMPSEMEEYMLHQSDKGF